MSKQRHRRRSQGGTTPETTPQTGSGVAHFSVSEVVQFSMSVDIQRTRGVLRLLALTIEGLWNGNSKDLLIMPSSPLCQQSCPLGLTHPPGA